MLLAGIALILRARSRPPIEDADVRPA
jgi:hypothetical protein